jgi:hypothetical protein
MKAEDDKNWEGATFDLQCTPSEAVFHAVLRSVMLLSQATPDDSLDEFKQSIAHLAGVEDDRAVILVCALLLENAVESCLTAFAPRFPQMADDRDLTFSLKTNFLKSLCLLPPHVLEAITPIRQIRNEFAHNLEIKDFNSVQERHFLALKTHREKILPNSKALDSRRKLVMEVTQHTLIAVGLFRIHIQLLRRFLNTDEFRRSFDVFCRVALLNLQREDGGRSLSAQENGSPPN